MGKRQEANLPYHPFLYTIDQIAGIIGVREVTVRQSYLFYESNAWGLPDPDLLQARNISPTLDREDWRVEERELKRWMKRKGFVIYG